MILAFLFCILLCVLVALGGVFIYFALDLVIDIIYDLVERFRER